MSSKTPSQQTHFSPNSKLQYRLISNNRLILLNRQSLFNQFLTNRNNPNDNFCLYLHRYCLQNRLEGYNYCIRHILYDKNAPFRQCTFINTNTGKRCPNAARRLERRDIVFCPWHIKKKNLDIKKRDSQSTNEKMPQEFKKENLKRKFEDLEHYCPSNEHDHRRKNVDWELPEDKCITASKSLREKINESINNLSLVQTDDDLTNALLSDVLNLDLVDSDNESAEGYMDDPLRHSGAYTAEEIAHVLRDKMLRLQTLYINLLNYYRYMLKSKMRDYYLNLKNEKSILVDSNVVETNFDQLKEQEDYKLLKAMYKYHNISGSEKIIKEAACEIRRSLVEESGQTPPSQSICAFVKDSITCNQSCLPLSSYCKSHILYDPHQILYRPCSGGSPPCLNPTISYVHTNNCIRHVQLKFEKSQIDDILKSPIKIENNENNENSSSMSELVNEPGMFHSMDDMALEMDPVGSNNMFGLDNFDLDNTDLLS